MRIGRVVRAVKDLLQQRGPIRGLVRPSGGARASRGSATGTCRSSDADSLLLPGYALRLVHLMNQLGNERVAVAQTPHSAIPQPSAILEPERLAYSATPPDFGALVIQRGRWANGGLIILPKLVRYLLKGPYRLTKLREGFFRIHYLTSIAGVNLGLALLIIYPFPDAFQSPWLPLTAMPYYALYARDLWQSGYRHGADLLRVYALNLLLLPVNLGGVLRSLHQGFKGHKIPFRRTPK